MINPPLAVRAHVQAWTRFLHLGIFDLTDRVANVSAWAVTETVSCFIIALSSLRYLLFPPNDTVLDAY